MSSLGPPKDEIDVSQQFSATKAPDVMDNPKIREEVDETVAKIVEELKIEPNRAMEWVVKDGMEKLLRVAAKQDQALQHLHELTGVTYAKINIEDVKHVNPGDYDDPQAVAQAMRAVLQAEAEKLLITSDFISDIRLNLDEMDPEVRAEFKSDLMAARKVAGKAIKGAILAYPYNNERRLPFSISHVPDVHLRSEVQPLLDKLQPYLDPET